MRQSISDRFHLRSNRFWVDVGLSVLLLAAVLLGEKFCHRFLFQLQIEQGYYVEGRAYGFLAEWSWKRFAFWGAVLIGCGVLQYVERIRLSDFSALSRWLLIVIVLTQTYTLAGMDYNHFYNHWYAPERLGMVASAGLVLWRPVFLPVFIIHVIALTTQLRFPVFIGYDHVHKFIAVPLLSYAWLSIIAGRFIRARVAGQLFAVLVIGMLALWYIMAGVGKLELGWQNDNSLYYLFAAATDAGWLSSWPQEVKVGLAEFLVTFESPLLWATILVEVLLPITLFLHRKWAFVSIVMLLGFHLTVYLFSGILFWQWSLLELCFLVYLYRTRHQTEPVFTARIRVLYLVTLLAMPFFTHIGRLAWYDCGYINSYTFRLVGPGGKQRLNATYFSPYDTGFAKNRFYFMSDFPVLASTYGQSRQVDLVGMVRDFEPGKEGAAAVEQLRTTAEVQYDRLRSEAFTEFLRTFVNNKNAYDPTWISHLAPPPHMQQGEDFGNLQYPEAETLEIIYEEKVVRPGLEYYPVRADTIIIPLKPTR